MNRLQIPGVRPTTPHADLTVPITLGIFPSYDGERLLLLDGTHRVHAASLRGTRTLPAYVLTCAEVAQIENSGNPLPTRRLEDNHA